MAVGQFDSTAGMIVQARMSSTRLPGKVLMPMPFASEKTLLGGIVKALSLSGAKIIVATSVDQENDPIEQLCKSEGIKCFRGSEDDVFSRFHTIQDQESFKTIFRFTADNPFIDLSKLTEFYRSFDASDVDYACSTGLPLGMNFEVMKGRVVLDLNNLELDEDEREHVTLRVKRDDSFSKKSIVLGDSADLRLTVDTALDYAQVSLIFSKLGGDVNLNKILRLKKNFPWLFKLNKGVMQKSFVSEERRLN